MATLKELKDKIGLKVLNRKIEDDREIADAYVCDLLSWVMANGKPNMAWVTVQTHLNVVAVASLHDFACIIVPEDIEVPGATVAKAEEESIAVFTTDKTAYQVCCELFSLGIGE
jgi:hypothetical protein